MTDTNNENVIETTQVKQPTMSRFHDWYELTGYLGSVASLVVAGPAVLLFVVNVYVAKIIEQGKYKLAAILVAVINIIPMIGVIIYLTTNPSRVNYIIMILLWTIASVLGLMSIKKQSSKV